MSTPITTLLRRPRSRAALGSFTRVDENAVTRRAALAALPGLMAGRFEPAAATGLSTVYELRVLASAGGPEERFRLAVEDGVLSIEPGPAPDNVAWVGVTLADMIRLVSGSSHVWGLMADHRLDLGGEPFTALRFPGLFGLI